jgi:hypothetical protein
VIDGIVLQFVAERLLAPAPHLQLANAEVKLQVRDISESNLALEKELWAERHSGQDTSPKFSLAVILQIEPIERDAAPDVWGNTGINREDPMQVQIACNHGDVPEARFDAGNECQVLIQRVPEVEPDQEVVWIDRESGVQPRGCEGGNCTEDQCKAENRNHPNAAHAAILLSNEGTGGRLLLAGDEAIVRSRPTQNHSCPVTAARTYIFATASGQQFESWRRPWAVGLGVGAGAFIESSAASIGSIIFPSAHMVYPTERIGRTFADVCRG